MRGPVKTIGLTIAALLGAPLLAVSATFTSAVTLAAVTATQALIVPGTGTPNPAQDYMDNAVDYYLVPAGDCEGGCTTVPVPYIAQFWPIPLPGWGGLKGAKWNVSVQSGVTSLTTTYNDVLLDNPPPDNAITIFGYSQGATVASLFKANLDNPANADYLNFLFIGNPQRPNGGFFERFAILGTVPILDATFGNPTPTDTCEHSNGDPCTTDVALQYDGVVDFPQYLLPLATLNAIAGFNYVHGTYLAPNGDDAPTETPYGYTAQEVEDAIAAAQADCSSATYCQRHGDTIYVTLPARTLPIMQPFIDLGEKTGTSAIVIPIVDFLSPAVQTLIERGYDRTDYGQPSPIRLIPRPHPVTLVQDLIQDIPEGIQAAKDPGLTPLPDSGATTSVTTLDARESTPARRPLTPLRLFAKPNLAVVTDKQAGPTLAKALGGDVHPVRDAAHAVKDTVRKVLGKSDDAA
jgi:hypothetical protein